MQAPEIMGPPIAKMFRKWLINFLHQARARNSHLSRGLYKSREVIQVEVIGAKVRDGIDTDDGVEKIIGERQRSRVGMNWKDAIVDTGVANALGILRGAEPEVGGPNLDAEFAAQENRRRRASATEVEDAHAGAQVERGG